MAVETLARRVLVFEPDVTGHHLQYVRVLVDALCEHVDAVDVILQKGACSSAAFVAHFAGLTYSNVRFLEDVEVPLNRGMYGTALASWQALCRAIRKYRPERVYVPYADGLIQVAGIHTLVSRRSLIPGVRIEALMMRGGFAYPSDSVASRVRQELMFQCVLRSPFDVVHVLDPLVLSEIERRSSLANSTRFRPIPEAVTPVPVLSQTSARRMLGIPQECDYLVCAGGIDARKGVDLLLIVALGGGLPVGAKLLLVGRISDDVRGLVRAAQSQIGDQLVVIDRYVTEEEFAFSILASNVVAVPYPAHQGSSGLLVRAAAADRFVLASDYGWVGWATRTFGLGLSVDVTSADTLRAAIAESFHRSRSHVRTTSCQRFLAFHTAENQKQHWLRGLRSSGCKSETVYPEWSDVL